MKMTIDELRFELLNKVDKEKVNEIKKSIIENGWKGQIFYCNLGLLTGSHRIQALRELQEDYDIEFDAIDLTNEVNEYCENNDCSYGDIDFDEINDMNEEEIVRYFTIDEE